jgi:hypothetical protein
MIYLFTQGGMREAKMLNLTFQTVSFGHQNTPPNIGTMAETAIALKKRTICKLPVSPYGRTF